MKPRTSELFDFKTLEHFSMYIVSQYLLYLSNLCYVFKCRHLINSIWTAEIEIEKISTEIKVKLVKRHQQHFQGSFLMIIFFEFQRNGYIEAFQFWWSTWSGAEHLLHQCSPESALFSDCFPRVL